MTATLPPDYTDGAESRPLSTSEGSVVAVGVANRSLMGLFGAAWRTGMRRTESEFGCREISFQPSTPSANPRPSKQHASSVVRGSFGCHTPFNTRS